MSFKLELEQSVGFPDPELDKQMVVDRFIDEDTWCRLEDARFLLDRNVSLHTQLLHNDDEQIAGISLDLTAEETRIRSFVGDTFRGLGIYNLIRIHNIHGVHSFVPKNGYEMTNEEVIDSQSGKRKGMQIKLYKLPEEEPKTPQFDCA